MAAPERNPGQREEALAKLAGMSQIHMAAKLYHHREGLRQGLAPPAGPPQPLLPRPALPPTWVVLAVLTDRA
jgi:hypothetical protein